ncbi:MAG: tyrosine-type recombinase/integrase [Lachnospiraceae bacterium]|nr:tyrosine-type recombinase/integrase [Lachnospiraceae bacterium]
MKKTLKNEILKLHPYPIKQMSGSDQRWYTYYYEDNERNIIKKNSEDEVYQALCKLYQLEEEPRTLKTLYGEFLEFKAMRLPKESGTVHRIDCEYRKYYADDEIIDIPICKLTKEYIETWAYKMIRNHQLKKKQYYNLITILKGTLEYAVYMRYITKNPYDTVKINTKTFKQDLKPKSSTQVYLVDEQPLVEEKAMQLFHETKDIAYLAIVLNFQLGLRIGELVALVYSDIENDILHVQKEEVRYKQVLNDKAEFDTYKVEVVNHTKGYEDRKVYLTPTALKLFDIIRNANEENGFYDGDYIFVGKNGRHHIWTLDKRLLICCKLAGLDKKSYHKIRKTYCSALLENGVSLEDVRLAMGHQDERTTLRNYVYSRHTESMKKQLFSNALATNAV